MMLPKKRVSRHKLRSISGVDLRELTVKLWDRYFTPDLMAQADDLLFLCRSGSGCSPTKSGTKVYGQFTDGEECYVRRGNIEGIVDE